MSALRQARRAATAREVAKKLGVSERTIRRYVAEPRADYDARLTARHEQIRQLRKQGLSYRAIAAEVGCSIGTVHNALRSQEAT